jgi:polar amino acid transport system substrate-binding protein
MTTYFNGIACVKNYTASYLKAAKYLRQFYLFCVCLTAVSAALAQSPAPVAPTKAKAPLSATQAKPNAAASAGATTATASLGRKIAPDVMRIQSRGELIVAMLALDSPPFFFVQDGKLQGSDVVLAEGIARSLGVTAKFDRRSKTFNEVIDEVSRGEADLAVSKISRTLSRAQAVSFSAPYMSFYHALLVNRVEFAKYAGGLTPVQALRDFKGTIGVITKSSFADFAKVTFPAAQIKDYPTWDLLVAAVERGEVVGAYRDELEVKRVLADKPKLSVTLRSITITNYRDTLGIAVDQNSPNVLALVNLYLETQHKMQTVQSVLSLPVSSTASLSVKP